MQRQLGTPTQDENVWDTIMGQSQYSVGMTLSPHGLPFPQISAVSASTATNLLKSMLKEGFESRTRPGKVLVVVASELLTGQTLMEVASD